MFIKSVSSRLGFYLKRLWFRNHSSKNQSNSLCVIPFIHLATRTNGDFRVCCMAKGLLSDRDRILKAGKDPIEGVWNSDDLRKLRISMINGERPEACQKCWREEALGESSKRERENHKYLLKYASRIEEASSSGGRLSEPPVYYDLRLNNLCNLSCRTCNPIFSNQWTRLLERVDFSAIHSDIASGWISSLGEGRQSQGRWDENIFKDILAKPSDLQEIYISGGEPLLMKSHFRFLKELVRLKLAPNIVLRLNTNMTYWSEDLGELLKNFKRVNFSASVDGVGLVNDYVRHPSQWREIEDNFRKVFELSQQNPSIEPSLNITVNALNVLYFCDVIEWLKGIDNKLTFSVTHLDQPDYLTVHVLDDDLKKKAILKLTELLADQRLSLKEISAVSSIIRRLGLLTENKLLKKSFCDFISVTDSLKQQKIIDFLPEIGRTL